MQLIKKYQKPILLALCFILIILLGSQVQGFLTFSNILNVTRQSATIAICAMTMAVVLIAREIDLSTGGMMAFCAMLSGNMMLAGMGVLPAMLLGMLAGAAMGVLNGIIIAKVEIPSFIATYVMGQVATGFALVAGKGRSIGGMPQFYVDIGNKSFLGIPILTIIMLLFLLGVTVIMNYTRMGKHIYALGGNEQTVRQEGISVDKIKIFSFALTGFAAATAGILLSAQMNAVHPTQGSSYQLDAVASSVIGGVSMLGGEGKPWMAVVGALIITFLRNILTLMGVYPFYQNLVVGTAIIVVVGISIYNRNRVLDAAKVF